MARGDYQGDAERTGYIGAVLGPERRAAFIALVNQERLIIRTALARLIDRAVVERTIPEVTAEGEDEE